MESRPNKHLWRAAIAGTGYIADLHVAALKKLENVRVIACCDPNLLRRSDFSSKWGIESVYDSLEKMLSEQNPDVVHVLAPPDKHYEVTREVLSAGASAFIEKPMAETSNQCLELVEMAERNHVTIGVNHNNIFHPAFIRLKRDVKEGRIGKIENVIYYQAGPIGQVEKGIYSHWMLRRPENILFELAPHPLSQIIDLLGQIEEINCMTSGLRTLGKGQYFYNRWQALLKCTRGFATIYLCFDNRCYPQGWLYVSGEDGAVRTDLFQNLYLVQDKSTVPEYAVSLANGLQYGSGISSGIANFINYCLSKLKIRERSDPFYISIKNSLRAFYQAISHKSQVPVSGHDGLNVVRACELWAESANLRKNTASKATHPGTMKNRPEILITGATGFIGKSLVKALLSQGLPVRVLVRSDYGLSEMFHSPLVEAKAGDMTDAKIANELLQGIKYVYHLAHGGGQTWEAFERANISATRHLAEAALKEKVKYFVHTSTIAVYCYHDIPKGKRLDETVPIDQHPQRRNFYARSKILAERVLTEMMQKANFPLVLFRPAVVVGIGGRVYHDGVGLWTRDNVCKYWGMGKNQLPFVLVEDVVQALVQVLYKDGLEGQIFNLVGDVRLTARDYVNQLKLYSHRKIHATPYPIILMFLSETFKYLIKCAIGEHKGALLSYRDLSNRAIKADFDCSKAKKLLNWRPCSDRQEFIQRAVGWAFESET